MIILHTRTFLPVVLDKICTLWNISNPAGYWALLSAKGEQLENEWHNHFKLYQINCLDLGNKKIQKYVEIPPSPSVDAHGSLKKCLFWPTSDCFIPATLIVDRGHCGFVGCLRTWLGARKKLTHRSYHELSTWAAWRTLVLYVVNWSVCSQHFQRNVEFTPEELSDHSNFGGKMCSTFNLLRAGAGLIILASLVAEILRFCHWWVKSCMYWSIFRTYIKLFKSWRVSCKVIVLR